MKVAKELTLKWGDYLPLSGGPDVIRKGPKIRRERDRKGEAEGDVITEE